MSTFGALTLGNGARQGPLAPGTTFSKLGAEISRAKIADVTVGSMSAGQGFLILFSDMRDSLQAIQNNTFHTMELLKSSIVGTPQEQKEAAIAAGETDPPPGETGTKGPGILSRIGSTLGKLNPFGGGGLIDTLGKLGLAVGGVALIKYFGEDMVPIMADLLRSLKEGKIGENIKIAYEYIKEKGLDAFENIKYYTKKFIDGAVTVLGIIKGAYTMVNDYIMSFDTSRHMEDEFGSMHEVGPDGRLDKAEFGALKEDLLDKAVTIIGRVISGVFTEFFNYLTSTDTLKALGSALLLYTPVAMILGKPTKGTTKPGTKGGFMRGAGIVAMLAYGIRQTYLNYEDALMAATDEMGDVDFKEFAIAFLGGTKNAAGSAAKGFEQAKAMGGTGMLAGMALGSIVPGVGTIVGGVFGLITGGIIGYFSGKAGTDKIREMVDGLSGTVDSFITDVGNFFTDLANGFKYLFSGRSFMKGFRRRGAGDVDELQEAVDEQLGVISVLERMQKDAPSAELEVAIKEAYKLLEERKSALEFAPSQSKLNQMEDLGDYRNQIMREYKHLRTRVYWDSFDSDPQINLNTATLPAETIMGKRLVEKDPNLLAALGPDATNYDAMKYYERLLNNNVIGRMMYGKAVAQAGDHMLQENLENKEFIETQGAEINADLSLEKMNKFKSNVGGVEYRLTPVNGGLESGGGLIVSPVSVDNSVKKADQTLVFSDGLSLNEKTSAKILASEGSIRLVGIPE